MSDAADKLARTRMAIIDHVHRRDRRDRQPDSADADGQEREPGAGGGDTFRRGAASRFAGFRRAATSWWRHHPAHLGLELATPVLSAYAVRQPALFLGIAAALGAVFMVIRPWRLISLTGLIVAVVKSSQLSSFVMSAMSAADFQKDDQNQR